MKMKKSFLVGRMLQEKIQVHLLTAPTSPAASPPALGQPSNSELTSTKTFKSPLKKEVKRRTSDDKDTKLLKIEKEILKYFQLNANDPDTQFLMSFVPFLKEIPQHRK